MPSVIECCVRNVCDERERHLRDGDGAVRVRPCLEHCSVCRTERFLVVDGELRVSDDRDGHRASATEGAE
jgi:uncharacterized protein YuzB (UPF0349 family)